MKSLAGLRGIATLVAALVIGAPSIARAKDEPVKYADRLVESKQVFQELTSSGA